MSFSDSKVNRDRREAAFEKAKQPARDPLPSFTPGPWSADAEARHNYYRVIRNVNRDPVALVVVAGWDKRSALAHTNLITNAPMAHQLVKEMLLSVDGDGFCDLRDWIRSARAYLAAVEGK